MKESWFIFDIDGTLCDNEHRVAYAQARDWANFHRKLVQDQPRRAECTLLRLIHQSGPLHRIALITGRPITYLAETERWLADNGMAWNEIYMRPEGDHSRDTELKKRVYEKNFRDRDVVAVFEDRDRVVEMWRSLGLTCFHVQPGAY